MKRLTSVSLLVAGMMIAAVARGQESPSPWKDASGTWEGGSAPKVTKMAAWPGKDEVIASAWGNGLWSTVDGGAHWKRMGQPGKTPPNAGGAVQFVFDPKNPQTMWTSGMYNYGVWKTADGGKTFTHLGNNNHVDGITVDFTDPARNTLLIGLHEQEHSLHKSTDGGLTWVKIGDKVPQGSEHTTDPIILDTKTYLTDSNGWSKPGESWAIYRTTDGGDTWTKVSSEGAAGNATITSNGNIFWSCQWDQRIIKSADHGKTWTKVNGPVHGIVVEVSPGRLVALGNNNKTQLCVSKNGGKNWTRIGTPAPFKAGGLTYDAVRKSFFLWATDDGGRTRSGGAIVRWDLPADVESVFSAAPE
jgi:photosystem II stability/assembly factor-like uncharacterized protein